MAAPDIFPYWYISHDQVESVRAELGCERVFPDLLLELVKRVKVHARCLVSKFQVGVVGVTRAGNIYCGVNVEFPPAQLNTCIHAEQSLVSNMLAHGDAELLTFMGDVPPCGHCRQFFKELPTEKELTLWVVRTTLDTAITGPLDQFLPYAFGPADLQVEHLISGTPSSRFTSSRTHESSNSVEIPAALLVEMKSKALDAINRSYSPYSLSPSAVVLATEDNKIYAGWYVENAAYTPSLAPFQSAACGLVRDHRPWTDIKFAMVIEQQDSQISHLNVTRVLLSNVAPSTGLVFEIAEE